MRFLLHGQLPPEIAPALLKHEHAVHLPAQLSADTEAIGEITADPELLLALLQKKQWQLLTSDAALIQKIYEGRLDFAGVIVLLLESAAAPNLKPIDRLFERYPRLTPRRLYTITPTRVKIRQLPGAGQASSRPSSSNSESKNLANNLAMPRSIIDRRLKTRCVATPPNALNITTPHSGIQPMLELSEQSAAEYLRSRRRVSSGELLIQSLSGGVANIVLKVFDPGAGEKIGSDPRSPEDLAAGAPDLRPHAGSCFVLKQPLGKFKTQTEWLVDIDRALVERDSMILVGSLLPQNSVPDVLWFDEENYVLTISCAPAGSVIWKKALMDGHTSTDASTNAGMMLAMMHSATHNDPAVKARYGDPKFFIQQRIDPYFNHTAAKHPQHAALLHALAEKLLATQHCLIHGDFSPKNIFLVPENPAADSLIASPRSAADSAKLLLLDFEVAFFGHAAFNVSTLVNHLLLKGFVHRQNWRPFMLMADNFWQTYRHTAAPELVRSVNAIAGHLLGALLLARVDGKSPAEYLLPHPELQAQVRRAADAILSQSDPSLEHALDTASPHFTPSN